MNDILIKKAEEHEELLAIIRECQRHPIDLFKSGYNPDEPRDDHGRWTNGGESTASQEKEHPDAIDSVYPIETVAAIIATLGSGAIPAAWESLATLLPEGATAVEEGTDLEWTLGKYKSETTWANQMAKGNWTPEEITNTIADGEISAAPNKVYPSNTATRYTNPSTGRFVVRDDVNKEILQVSRDGFFPNQTPITTKIDIDIYRAYTPKFRKYLRSKKVKKMFSKTVTIYIDLPEEGTPTIRQTQGIDLGNGLYKVLPAPDYDPEDEVWEFLPGSIVRCEKRLNDWLKKDILIAVEKVA